MHGAMFVPIILGSDKTTVSVATGNNEYWPVYLSIGNIHNNVRRAHRNGVVLLGFLSIPKSIYSFLISFISLTQFSTHKLTRSTRMMLISGNFDSNYFILRFPGFCSHWSLGWRHPKLFAVLMAIFDARSMALGHTLLIIRNKPCWPVLYKVGVQSKFNIIVYDMLRFSLFKLD